MFKLDNSSLDLAISSNCNKNHTSFSNIENRYLLSEKLFHILMLNKKKIKII